MKMKIASFHFINFLMKVHTNSVISFLWIWALIQTQESGCDETKLFLFIFCLVGEWDKQCLKSPDLNS